MNGMDTFTLGGSIDGVARRITWEDGIFYGDVGESFELIARGDTVALTPTGPFFPAAAKPIEIALLTARACFDDLRVEYDDAAEAILTAMRDEYELTDSLLSA